MDKSEKDAELTRLLAESEAYKDALHATDNPRIWSLDNGSKFVKWHDVATDGKFLGFVAVPIPDPKLSADEQFDELTQIYGDELIVKSCLNSIAIKRQQDARKSLTMKTIPKAEFNRRYNALDVKTLQRLKSMEHITEHIEQQWELEQADVADGQIRLF